MSCRTRRVHRAVVIALVVGLAAVGLVVMGCDRDSSPEESYDEAAAAAEPQVQEQSEEQPDEQPEAQEEPDDDTEVVEQPDESDSVDELPARLDSPSYSAGRGEVRMFVGEVPDQVSEALDESDDHRIAFDPSQWDTPYSNLEELEVLTREAPRRVRVTEVVRTSGPEGHGFEEYLETEPVDNLGGSVDGTFYAGPGVFSEDSRLGTIGSEPVDDELAKEVWELFWNDEEFPESFRETVEEYFEHTGESVDEPKLDEYIQQYRAQFAPDYPRLVTVEINPGQDAGPRWIECVGAGYLVDETGEQIKEVKSSHGGFYCLSPTSKVDLEGDGTWGVLYTEGTEPHPYSLKLMEFDDSGEPSRRGVYSWD